MSDWHGWTPDEEIVLVWFLSCGIKTSAVRKLIAYKCGTAQHDERDMKRHVFDLHHDSQRDTWNGFGPLLVPLRRKKPRPSARIPKIRAIDWKYNWGEYNVDDWLIQKTWRSEHLQTLTFVGENEEALIRHEQYLDEIDWDWVEHRQRELVHRHVTKHDDNVNILTPEHDNLA